MANYIPRVWQARQGTNLNKFAKSGETSSHVILTNDPDNITVEGTPFTASAMNNIETGLQNVHAISYSLETLTSLLPAETLGMTSDGTYAYIAVYDPDAGEGKIVRVVLSTGSVADFVTGLNSFRDITLYGDYLYIIVKNGATNSTVKKIHKTTGAITDLSTIALTDVQGICTDGINLYFTDTAKVRYYTLADNSLHDLIVMDAQGGIAIHAGNVYAVDTGNAKIVKIDKTTGAHSDLITGLTNPNTVLTDGIWVYFNDADDTIKRITIDGNSLSTIISGAPLSSLSGFILTDHLYAISSVSGKMFKIVATGDYIAPSKILLQAVSTANVTVTEDRFGNILLSGTLTGNREVILPNTVRKYTVINSCTGAYYVTVKTASGTGIICRQNDLVQVYCNGTDIIALDTPFESFVPSFTGLTVGNGTLFGWVRKKGRDVKGIVHFKLGSTSSIGTIPKLVLPFTRLASYPATTIPTGSAILYDASAGAYWLGKITDDGGLCADVVSGSYIRILYISSSVPFTWTTNDEIGFDFHYITTD